MLPRVAILPAFFACLAAGAHASLGLATGASQATLGVDAKGDAQVAWHAGGGADSVLVPPQGLLFHGGSLAGPDVSRKANVARLPFVVALRRTPDGSYWALQESEIGSGNPVSLDLSHWQGAPPVITLTDDGTRLRGTVSFHGKPVSGTTFTNAGLKPRIYVYLDCFACSGKPVWTLMQGVAPRADGSFAVFLRHGWQGTRYRATMAGPNTESNGSSTLAPDVQTVISAKEAKRLLR